MIFAVALFSTLLFGSTNAQMRQGLRGDRPGRGDGPNRTIDGPSGARPERPMFDLERLNGDAFVNSTCVNTDEAPICLARPSKDDISDGTAVEGVWVCRSFYHPRTGELERSETSCIEPSRGLESDVCGCCDDSCPVACECSCETEDGEEGVWIEFAKKKGRRDGEEDTDEDDVMETKCVPVGLAPSITARDRAQCVTTCPV